MPELKSHRNAPNRIIPVDCTIDVSDSATVSQAVNLEGATLCGFILPATFTGTTITFQIADEEGGTYVNLYDKTNTQVSFSVTQGRGYSVDPALFACAQFIKLVSGSTEGADRVIKLLVRKID